MNLSLNVYAKAMLLLALMTAGIAFAGPGHDHSDAAPATSAGKASPRFDAHSDMFEVVGVLSSGELSIFIDRYASNEPVLKAKVDVECGALKAVAQFHAGHGDYRLPSKPFEKPGTYPINLTITAGDEVDILAGNLVVPDPHAGHDHSHDARAWKRWTALGAVMAALTLAALFVIRRRATRIRHV